MKYKNKSRHKMLLQLADSIKEIIPGEIFETTEVLNYSFLERIVEKKAKPSAPVTKTVKKKPIKKKVTPTPKKNLDGSDKTEA